MWSGSRLSSVIVDQQENTTALYLASMNGHDKVVRILLAAKARVNTQDKVRSLGMENRLTVLLIIYPICDVVQWGQSPLWLASSNGHQECVKLLVDAKAMVDIQKAVSVYISMYL